MCVEGNIGCTGEYGGVVWTVVGVWYMDCGGCGWKDVGMVATSYAANALRCDVWVVCACIAVPIVACFICFWGKCLS